MSDRDLSKFVALNRLEEKVNQLLGIEKPSLVKLMSSNMLLPNYDSKDDEVIAEDCSFQNINSLDSFLKRKENSFDVVAKAVKLYDLQIEMIEKELNSLEKRVKENSDVVPSSNSSIISSSQSPITVDSVHMKIDFEDVEVPCSSGNIFNNQKHHSDKRGQERPSPKKRKLNTNALIEKEMLKLNAKAAVLYDSQIEMFKKKLNSLGNIDKKRPDVVPSSNSSNISVPQSPIADNDFQMKVEFEDVEVPCSSANVSNNQKHYNDNWVQERSSRKFSTNALTCNDHVTNYGGRIKTEIITENETDDNIKWFTNESVSIIDSAITPSQLTPAPTSPTLINNLQYTSAAALPPTLQPSQNLAKHRLDASTNTDDLCKNHSCSHQSILIKISNVLQETQQTNNNLIHFIERLCAAEEKKISLMEDANKEQKRHNQQIEKVEKS